MDQETRGQLAEMHEMYADAAVHGRLKEEAADPMMAGWTKAKAAMERCGALMRTKNLQSGHREIILDAKRTVSFVRNLRYANDHLHDHVVLQVLACNTQASWHPSVYTACQEWLEGRSDEMDPLDLEQHAELMEIYATAWQTQRGSMLEKAEDEAPMADVADKDGPPRTTYKKKRAREKEADTQADKQVKDKGAKRKKAAPLQLAPLPPLAPPPSPADLQGKWSVTLESTGGLVGHVSVAGTAVRFTTPDGAECVLELSDTGMQSKKDKKLGKYWAVERKDEALEWHAEYVGEREGAAAPTWVKKDGDFTGDSRPRLRWVRAEA